MTSPRTQHEPRSFRGLRVGVVGLGVEGVDIVRFLQIEGAAEIVVSERRRLDELAPSTRELAGIDYRLTTNDPRLATEIDALFVSQGVADDLPLVEAARARELPITAMMRHFLHRCPAPTIGISGSAGKTTTTTLVGEMLRAAGRKTFVGGNIGQGLLSALSEIDAETDVVLELSHTQLVRTDRSPQLAALLNITPNHLDQFSWEAYVDLKRNLLRHQRGEDVVVLPSDDEVASKLAADTPASLIRFGIEAFRGQGATVDNDRIRWHGPAGPIDVCGVDAVRIPGRHNLYNVLAAVAIASARGVEPEPIAEAIASFRGVAHRLQTVAKVDGVRYIDDSIATAPERTVAALRATDEPVVLLLGGREKRLPFETLADEARQRARAVICFGEAAAVFARQLKDAWQGDSEAPRVEVVDDLAAAVAAARAGAAEGDVVLLSPAGTSFDAYENFAARGDHFTSLATEQEYPRGSS